MTSLVSIALAVVALAVAVLALRRADVVERRMRAWLADGPAPRPGTPVTQSVQGPAATGSDGLRRIAVVRYDAFEDLGGRMSFSAAIVDDTGRGLVLTAIHGRSETRSYVKTVPAPDDGSQRQLSPEEAQALREALGAKGTAS